MADANGGVVPHVSPDAWDLTRDDRRRVRRPRSAARISASIVRSIEMVMPDWPGRGRAETLRQWGTLSALLRRVGDDPAFAAAVLVGSFADGRADALSDIDMLLFAPDGGFASAWERRHALHVTGALVAWDERREPEREIGKHQWVTAEMVYIECLIATPASGCRLAEPYVVLAGNLPPNVTHRPPISRSELVSAPHPVERAYDWFKVAVRHPDRAPIDPPAG